MLNILIKYKLLQFGKEILKTFPDINELYVGEEHNCGYSGSEWYLVIKSPSDYKVVHTMPLYYNDTTEKMLKLYNLDTIFIPTDTKPYTELEGTVWDILDFIKNNKHFAKEEIDNEIKLKLEHIDEIKNEIELIKTVI